ncbi:unnamed protein product [Cercospora beticola]|nr:unnamed protein product [Cercospora beticola]
MWPFKIVPYLQTVASFFALNETVSNAYVVCRTYCNGRTAACYAHAIIIPPPHRILTTLENCIAIQDNCKINCDLLTPWPMAHERFEGSITLCDDLNTTSIPLI